MLRPLVLLLALAPLLPGVLVPRPALAQGAAASPAVGVRAPLELPWHHPARELLEILHAAGHLAELPPLEVGLLRDLDLAGLDGAAVAAADGAAADGAAAAVAAADGAAADEAAADGAAADGAAWDGAAGAGAFGAAAAAWADRLRRELPPPDGAGDVRVPHAVHVAAVARGGEDFLDGGDRFGGYAEAAVRLGRRLSAGGELPLGDVLGAQRGPIVHATGRWGGAALTVGRVPWRLGPGADDLLLGGTLPLAGARLSSAEPFRLPGPLARLGRWNATLLVAAPGEAGVVDDPWYGSMALSLDPVPALRVGVARTALFGGEGMPGVTPGRLLRMIAGRHSTHEGEFEDQYAQIFLRARLPVAGGGVALYGAFAINDTQAAFRDDPAALAGLLVPLAPRGWLGALRYEYHAYGARARICTWCDVRRERTWFTHYVFGPHARAGLPFGSTLGGYGARHRLRWSAFDPSARWDVRLDATADVREEGNLLVEQWPGRRRALRLRAGYRSRETLRLWVEGGVSGGPRASPATRIELGGSWRLSGF